MLRFCLSQSTAHGLGNIGNEPHISGRIIWSLLTIFTLGFFIYHTYLLYGQLLDEKVLVSTHQFSIDFIQPDIVFCSDRIFARDYINDPPGDEYEYMLNVSKNIQSFDKLYRKSGHNLTTVIWDTLNLHQLFKAFFHRKHQLFLRMTCNLKDIGMDMSSLQVEPNYHYFACFRLNTSACKLRNPFDNLVIKFYTHIFGVNITYSKLNVLINNRTIDTYLFDQRDPTDEMEDGIHIFFVRPNEAISSRTTKVTASVNTHTYIKIFSTKFMRIPTKSFQCTTNSSYVRIYNLLEENINTNFVNVSKNSICIQSLFQENLHDTRGCISTKFPITKNIPLNFSFCGNLSHHTKSIDYMTLWNDPLVLDPIIAKCKEERHCTTVYHRAAVNYNHWPRKSTMRNLFKIDVPRRLQYIKRNNLSSPGLTEAYEDYKRRPQNINNWQRNFIKVSISPGEFRSTFVEESLSYSFKNFFSDIGGIMGFYMGASLLTLCEIFRLMHYVIHSIIVPQKKDTDVEAQVLNDGTTL